MAVSQDIQNFKILFYCKSDNRSPIEEYISDLMVDKKEMAIKAFSAIINLPIKIVNNEGIKPMKYKDKVVFWELRVKSGSNICRFFYTLDRPNVIIIHGFTKKTQKTDDKDIQQGLRNLEDYRENKNVISIESITGN